MDGNADLYHYNLVNGTECLITTNEAIQRFPVLHEGIVVYEDRRNISEIYMSDLDSGKETAITTTIAGNPSFQDFSIVWQDKRNGNPDIYLYR